MSSAEGTFQLRDVMVRVSFLCYGEGMWGLSYIQVDRSEDQSTGSYSSLSLEFTHIQPADLLSA